jgi:hypothetical protein
MLFSWCVSIPFPSVRYHFINSKYKTLGPEDEGTSMKMPSPSKQSRSFASHNSLAKYASSSDATIPLNPDSIPSTPYSERSSYAPASLITVATPPLGYYYNPYEAQYAQGHQGQYWNSERSHAI